MRCSLARIIPSAEEWDDEERRRRTYERGRARSRVASNPGEKRKIINTAEIPSRIHDPPRAPLPNRGTMPRGIGSVTSPLSRYPL